MTIYSALSAYDGGAWVELYEIDLTKFGQPIFRFHNGVNGKYENVVWNGNTYTAFPAQVSGFEKSSTGFARPKISVANISGVISSTLASFSNLLTCKFTRIRTMVKYLDAVNFAGGNPTADPTQKLPDDVFYIVQKTKEDKYVVEWELGAATDLQGVMLPRRQVISNLCTWKYRGQECGYVGGAVATSADIATSDPALDSCSRTLKGCKYRFGANGELPFGGFVGSAIIQGSG